MLLPGSFFIFHVKLNCFLIPHMRDGNLASASWRIITPGNPAHAGFYGSFHQNFRVN